MGNNEVLAVCGSMQDVAAPPTSLRIRKELQAAAVTSADSPNDALLVPVPEAEHRSIERYPVCVVEPRQTVPAPLHLTLGFTEHALRLGIEAVVCESGAAAGAGAARAVGMEWLFSERVCPVPYHGGGFEGLDCHSIVTAPRTAHPSPSKPIAHPNVLWMGVFYLCGSPPISHPNVLWMGF